MATCNLLHKLSALFVDSRTSSTPISSMAQKKSIVGPSSNLSFVSVVTAFLPWVFCINQTFKYFFCSLVSIPYTNQMTMSKIIDKGITQNFNHVAQIPRIFFYVEYVQITWFVFLVIKHSVKALTHRSSVGIIQCLSINCVDFCTETL